MKVVVVEAASKNAMGPPPIKSPQKLAPPPPPSPSVAETKSTRTLRLVSNILSDNASSD